MKERPILFSGPMVRAILDGRKTQTRRVVKLPLHCKSTGCELTPGELNQREINSADTLCPHGAPGDRLWVRETWTPCSSFQKGEPITAVTFKDGGQKYKDGHYVAPLPQYSSGAWDGIKWRPSIHMPRWASRITLEITGIRVERVQYISESDAKAEGVVAVPKVGDSPEYWTARKSFEHLWDSINAERGFGWDVNPWVWVVEFKRIENGALGEAALPTAK